jgi:hypothetical protein
MQDKKTQATSQTLRHRVITMLDRREIDFLDKLGKDALFSAGHKLTYNDILRGLVDLAMELGLTEEKIDSLTALKEKMLELMKRSLDRDLNT